MRISSETGMYEPVVDEKKCIDCGLCEQVCPMRFVDLTKLSRRVFGRLPEDPYVGTVRAVYVGHATDEGLRYQAASGGVATVLISKAIEDGLIDGALLVRMNNRRPILPEPFIAKSPSEVKEAMGSKYCPVPINALLRYVINSDGVFAMTTTPCQMLGLRKAEELIDGLKERIRLHIGLFCNHMVNFYGTSLILYKMGVEPREVVKLAWRSRGWPGGMTIWLRNGREVFCDLHYYMTFVNPFIFTPMACLICPDATNELADISLGDAWHMPEVTGQRSPGFSIVVVRTRLGEELLASATEEGLIKLIEIDRALLVYSKRSQLRFKKKALLAKRRMLTHIFETKDVPDLKPVRPLTPALRDWLATTMALIAVRLSKPTLFGVFSKLPYMLYRVYHAMFYKVVGGSP